MSRDWTAFTIFWGVWLLVPILIDGLTTLFQIIGSAWASRRSKKQSTANPAHAYDPLVSILVPVYNSERTLRRCLQALCQQTYPQDRIEIIVIDNGSTDGSLAVLDDESLQTFKGTLTRIAIPDRGKAWALNAGIHVAHGSLIFNVDADTALDSDAVRQMTRAFESDPSLISATGVIEVLPTEDPAPNFLKALLAECEYVEYLASFKVGRVYQSLNNNLYTLAGAFSAFRREVLLKTFLYSQRTVTEDTDMTFDLHQRLREGHIACVPDAIAFVEPVPSLRALYSQRVRWQRGELEVIALHEEMLSNRNFLRVSGLAPERLLLIDHTLSFPRLAWLFFFPMLAFFGYSLALVIQAALFMYAFYMLTEGLWFLTTFWLSEPSARQRLRRNAWVFAFMPLYRFLIFWLRLAGFLAAQAEPPNWRVTDPVTLTQAGLRDARLKVQQGLSMLIALIGLTTR